MDSWWLPAAVSSPPLVVSSNLRAFRLPCLWSVHAVALSLDPPQASPTVTVACHTSLRPHRDVVASCSDQGPTRAAISSSHAAPASTSLAAWVLCSLRQSLIPLVETIVGFRSWECTSWPMSHQFVAFQGKFRFALMFLQGGCFRFGRSRWALRESHRLDAFPARGKGRAEEARKERNEQGKRDLDESDPRRWSGQIPGRPPRRR